MAIETQKITVVYNDRPVVRSVSFRADDGEIVALLGPSGSGKTTLLLAIAGLLPRTAKNSGHVLLNNHDISNVLASNRGIPLVFQNYALFPNMTVFGNVSFPLRIRRLPTKEIDKQTWDILALLRLADKAWSHPHELSGGEQQRVALGRSLILKPKVMLLDEPVGALDKHLRDGILHELKKLQQELGITMIYVTHDQTEALYLADKVAVLKEGTLQQFGPCALVYTQPINLFVAKFLGTINLIPAYLKSLSNNVAVYTTVLGLELESHTFGRDLVLRNRYMLGIRPENIALTQADGSGKMGVVEKIPFIGGSPRYGIRVEGISDLLISNGPSGGKIRIGDSVRVSWSPDHLVPMEEESLEQ